MRVVFIDDGINLDFIHNNKEYVHIKGTYSVIGNKVSVDTIKYSEVSHSSICAKIFIDDVNSDCDIYFIKVLDMQTLKGNIQSLAVALDWCLYNYIDVINLSLGTTNIKEAALLQKSVEKLVKRNVVIVSAASNSGFLTFPAAFNDIIGIKALNSQNTAFPSDCIFYKVPKKEYFFNGKTIITFDYNSFAAPAITAKVCDCIHNGVTAVQDIRAYLVKNKIVKIYKKNKYYKHTQPIMLFTIKEHDTSINAIRDTLIYFSQKGYYGICISDTLLTDFTKGIINIGDIELGINDFRYKLSYLTSYIDADYYIWHMQEKALGINNRRSVDLVVKDGIDEDKLDFMLKSFSA